jgi:hypothetical protein
MSRDIDSLRDVEGANARVIARLEAVDFTVEYIREDVEQQYSEDDLDEAYQTIMGTQVASDDFKRLIGEPFEAQTLFFEGIVVLLLPSSRYQATFASFDRHEEFPVNDVVDAATRISG